MDKYDEFAIWVKQWEIAQKDFANEDKKPTQQNDYFFNSPAAERYEDSEEINNDWLDVYRKSMALSDDQLLNESNDLNVMAGYTGYQPFNVPRQENKLSKGTKNKVYTQNPIHFATVGPDGESEAGHVRISDNFTDGTDLRKLNDLKKQMEIMEREFHDADIMNAKNKGKVLKELYKIREQVKKLSQKIVPPANKDYA